jgi:hypothetical protein
MSSYVFNVVVESLQILTFDLGSSDQTVKDFPLHVVWEVGLDEQLVSGTLSWPAKITSTFVRRLIDWTQLGRFHLKDTESNLRNVMF